MCPLSGVGSLLQPGLVPEMELRSPGFHSKQVYMLSHTPILLTVFNPNSWQSKYVIELDIEEHTVWGTILLLTHQQQPADIPPYLISPLVSLLRGASPLWWFTTTFASPLSSFYYFLGSSPAPSSFIIPSLRASFQAKILPVLGLFL